MLDFDQPMSQKLRGCRSEAGLPPKSPTSRGKRPNIPKSPSHGGLHSARSSTPNRSASSNAGSVERNIESLRIGPLSPRSNTSQGQVN